MLKKKKTYDCLLKSSTHLVELNLQGVFPNELKLAKVTPKDDPTLFANYRPVSVLSFFSKILENIMYKRILTYPETNNILCLYDKQFGFREGHSTFHALTVLCNKLYEALDKGHYALGIFLDFSKAFDTIHHAILLKKN